MMYNGGANERNNVGMPSDSYALYFNQYIVFDASVGFLKPISLRWRRLR
jgi:hypothetical protein